MQIHPLTMNSCCIHCESDPCQRDAHHDTLVGHASTLHESLSLNEWRKILYQVYVHDVWGSLGKGHCKVIPECVKNLICEIFPDPNGNYMDHKDY